MAVCLRPLVRIGRVLSRVHTTLRPDVPLPPFLTWKTKCFGRSEPPLDGPQDGALGLPRAFPPGVAPAVPQPPAEPHLRPGVFLPAEALKWSDEQQTVFNVVAREGKRLVVIDSKAGSGKTTTLLQSLAYVPPGKKVLVLSFGRKNVDDLRERVQEMRGKYLLPTVKVSTFHALGLKAWLKHRGEIDGDADACTQDEYGYEHEAREQIIDTEKTLRILRQIEPDSWKLSDSQVKTVIQLVSMAKMHGLVPIGVPKGARGLDTNTPEDWELRDNEEGWEALGTMNKNPLLDFDDMLYLPNIAKGCVSPATIGYDGKEEWDYVFIDEAQDLSEMRAKLFAGCTSNLFGELTEAATTANELERLIGGNSNRPLHARLSHISLAEASLANLSTSYRCPKEHINVANKIVPKIKARDDAVDGLIDFSGDSLILEDMTSEDGQRYPLIIGRRVDTVVEFGFYLLSKGKPVEVLGRGVGVALLPFFDRQLLGKHLERVGRADADMKDLELEDFRELEMMRFFNIRRMKVVRSFAAYADARDNLTELGVRDKDDVTSLEFQFYLDRLDSIITICKAMVKEVESGALKSFTIADVRRRLRDNDVGRDIDRVRLTTYHKSRGMESEHVCILKDAWLETKTQDAGSGKNVGWSMTDPAETNLRYIAMTRSKNRLSFISETKEMQEIKADIKSRKSSAPSWSESRSPCNFEDILNDIRSERKMTDVHS
ncbi:hypothetical protein HK101_011870 [Irineochytrium annulatum]|nr:hypothetical protein HK101_011870 [Irineochytrium annulatum]